MLSDAERLDSRLLRLRLARLRRTHLMTAAWDRENGYFLFFAVQAGVGARVPGGGGQVARRSRNHAPPTGRRHSGTGPPGDVFAVFRAVSNGPAVVTAFVPAGGESRRRRPDFSRAAGMTQRCGIDGENCVPHFHSDHYAKVCL
jgi:hypothetical protein